MNNQQSNKRNAGNDINTRGNISNKRSKHHNNSNDDNDSTSISTASTSTFVTQDDLKQQLQDFQNQLLTSLKHQLAPLITNLNLTNWHQYEPCTTVGSTLHNVATATSVQLLLALYTTSL